MNDVLTDARGRRYARRQVHTGDHSIDFGVRCSPSGGRGLRYHYHAYALYLDHSKQQYVPFTTDTMRRWRFKTHGNKTASDHTNRQNNVAAVWRLLPFSRAKRPYAGKDGVSAHVTFRAGKILDSQGNPVATHDVLVGIHVSLATRTEQFAQSTAYYHLTLEGRPAAADEDRVRNAINSIEHLLPTLGSTSTQWDDPDQLSTLQHLKRQIAYLYHLAPREFESALSTMANHPREEILFLLQFSRARWHELRTRVTTYDAFRHPVNIFLQEYRQILKI